MSYESIISVFQIIGISIIGNLLTKLFPKYREWISGIFIISVSVFCYFSNQKRFLLLFCVSVILNVVMGRILCRIRNEKKRKVIFIASVSADILVLALFKYLSFIQTSLVMPLGLSFFSFREISYLIDIYLGKITPLHNPLSDVSYIMMFTQLQSGPITKYKDFVNADLNVHTLSYSKYISHVSDGIPRIMVGFIKKTLIADTLSDIVKMSFAQDVKNLSLPIAWMSAVCFSLQLYYDFSSFSDMAIGLTNILGYKCPENFNYPYASASISEFWRRWHITLGSWFKEYVYFPLGGSRCSKARVFFNLLIVWLLTGLWHGSKLSFVVWGLLHCCFAVIEHFTGIHKTENKALKIIWRIVTLLVVLLGWVMFRADSVMHGLLYIKAMVIPNANVDMLSCIQTVSPYLIVMIIALVFSLPLIQKIKEKLAGKKAEKVYEWFMTCSVILLFAVSLAIQINRGTNTFVYANF